MTISPAIGESVPTAKFKFAILRCGWFSRLCLYLQSKILGNSQFEIRISRRYIRDGLFRWPYKQCAE